MKYLQVVMMLPVCAVCLALLFGSWAWLVVVAAVLVAGSLTLIHDARND